MDATTDLYGNLLDEFAPPPTPPAQVRAQSLRKTKNVQSQITNNVAAQEPVSTQPDPYGPPPSAAGGAQPPQPRGRSGLVQQAQGALPGLYAEQEKAMGPQDYSGMQDYAKKRGAEGQHALLLSLAAQTAGKDFEPIQGAMLKRAMAARDPLKTSTGFITDTGEHIEDAQLRADQRLKQVSAQIARNEQIIQSAATAEEKAAAQREQMELKREQMAATMEMRRMTAAIAQGAAGDRRLAQQGQADARTLQNANALRDDFREVDEKAREGQRAAQQIAQIVPQQVAGMNAQQQQATVFAFMRMLDPGSVVRESEYALAERGKGVIDTLLNYKTQLESGKKLTPQQVTNMAALAREIDAANEGIIQGKARQFQEMGATYGIPSHLITPGYGTPSRPQRPAGAVVPDGAPAPVAAPAGRPSRPPGAVQPL